ncbi:MAG TPA: hypothetical protein VGG69_12340 [Rhizomicrobium sp.]|jgi:hypothetical protein
MQKAPMRSLGDVLYNFHWIVRGEAARSAQAWAGFLGPFLRAHDIASVINLRGANPRWRWWHYERSVCANLGVQHCDVKVNSRNLPTRELLLGMLDAFDAAKRPFLIKCSGGQDRTSFSAALYLLHMQGLEARDAAEGQFARWPYLHLPRRQQRWLKLFLPYLEEQIGRRSLRAWLVEEYRPENFKAWLEAEGFGDSFRTIQKPIHARRAA